MSQVSMQNRVTSATQPAGWGSQPNGLSSPGQAVHLPGLNATSWQTGPTPQWGPPAPQPGMPTLRAIMQEEQRVTLCSKDLVKAMSAFAAGAYTTPPVSRPARCALGLTQKQACPYFKPRPSAFRLCRQAKLQTLTCTASTAAQPLHSAHPSPVHRVAATVLSFWQHSLRQLASLLQIKPAQPEQKQAGSQDINAQIKASIKNMRCLAAVAPFAAASGSTNTFILITKAVGSFIKLYLLLLFLRVLLSWFPAFGWDKQPWLALRQVTDPYLNLFRGLVPPLLGTIDFTPLFGFLILQFLAGTLDLGAEDEW